MTRRGRRVHRGSVAVALAAVALASGGVARAQQQQQQPGAGAGAGADAGAGANAGGGGAEQQGGAAGAGQGNADGANASGGAGDNAGAGAGAGAGANANGGAGGEGEAAGGDGEGEGAGSGSGSGGAAGGAEPAVPALTEEQRRTIGAVEGELVDRGEDPPRRFVLPPYLYERGRRHETRVVFPLYFNSRVGDERRLVIPPYYQLRTPRVDGDVVFPLFFSFRGRPGAGADAGATWSTTVVGPAWHHASRGPGRAHALNYGLFPLFSYGEDFDRRGWLRSEHLVIPALLTFHRWWPNGQTTIAGPVVYLRSGSTVDWAAFPFVFRHVTPQTSWTAVPLLLAYRRVSHEDNRTFTLVGPYWSDVGPTSASYNFAPVLFHAHDRETSRTTVLPLFHTESGRDRFSFVTPLGGYARTAGNETTLVLPFYQNHRGITDLDAVAPLFFYSRSARLGTSAVVVPPLLTFHASSPTGTSWAALGLLARFHEYGRYDTIATPLFVHSDVQERRASVTWIFPTIHREVSPDRRVFNIYPLLYTARGRDWHHDVFFPFVWSVANRTQGTQLTVVAPFYGRYTERAGFTQWIFPNYVYWENTRQGQRGFGWDFFPFVQYGEPRPGDYYWSILHGLVGHRRAGSYSQTQLFWIPIGGGGGRSGGRSRQARGAESDDVRLEL